jgi:hypothetical protein
LVANAPRGVRSNVAAGHAARPSTTKAAPDGQIPLEIRTRVEHGPVPAGYPGLRYVALPNGCERRSAARVASGLPPSGHRHAGQRIGKGIPPVGRGLVWPLHGLAKERSGRVPCLQGRVPCLRGTAVNTAIRLRFPSISGRKRPTTAQFSVQPSWETCTAGRARRDAPMCVTREEIARRNTVWADPPVRVGAHFAPRHRSCGGAGRCVLGSGRRRVLQDLAR